jgi:hypothetical protein
MSPQDIPVFTKSLPSIAYTGVYEKQVKEEGDLAYFRNSLAPDWLKDDTYGKKVENVLVDLKPLPFDPQILATLQVGEAIHRKADATAEKVKTYPMGKRPAASFANLIRERTMKQYGRPAQQEARDGLQSAAHEKPAEPFPTNKGKTASSHGTR